MSTHSKAKRDARKKKRLKPALVRAGPLLRPHAEILDGKGKLLGGAGFRDGDWVMLMGGREVASTDSPAMVIAMLMHAADVRHEATQGRGKKSVARQSETFQFAESAFHP